jgi:hypothetical protein
MRLDVVELHALALKKAFERADLIDDTVGQFFRAHLHLAPAETLQVGQGGMGANLDTMLLRQPHGLRHHRRIGGVEAAGDVGDRNVRHEPFVVAHLVEAEAFTHVAIDRDLGVRSRCGHRPDLHIPTGPIVSSIGKLRGSYPNQ